MVETSWSYLVATFVDRFRADAGSIIVHYLDQAQARVLYPLNMPVEGLWRHTNQCALNRSWMQVVNRSKGPGTVSQLLLKGHACTGSTRFMRGMKLKGLRHVLFAEIARNDWTRVFLVLLRRADQNPFGILEIQEMRTMTPVIACTWALQREARRYATFMTSTGDILDFLSLGVVVVNREGNVFQMNSRAQDLIALGDALSLRGGRLSCRSHQETEKLRIALRYTSEAAANNDHSSETALSIARSDDHPPLQALLAPLPAGHWRQGRRTPLISMFLCDAAGTTSPKAHWLQELYGLTRVEAEVAVLLCHGYHPEGIAEHLHISVHTVRGYMTEIFAKAGVSRQTDLLRQLMVFAARLQSE